MKSAQFKQLVLVSAISAMLAACGGGGGGSTPTSIPAVTPAPTPVVCLAPQVNQNGECVTPAPTFNAALKPADLTMACESTYKPATFLVDSTVSSEFRYSQNEWGATNMTGWTQCIAAGFSAPNTIVSHWTWDWGNNTTVGAVGSGVNTTYVKSYPNIMYGAPNRVTTPTFPKQVATIHTATVNWDMEITHQASTGGVGRDGGNLFFDIYFSTDAHPMSSQGSTVNANLSINVARWGSMDFWNSPFELVTIDGVEYKFNSAPSNLTGNTAIGATFNTTSQQYSGTINVISFINFMKARGIIIDANWLDNIQIGTEISEGKGEAKLNKFAVTVN